MYNTQTQLFRRNPNLGAISAYSSCLWDFICKIISAQEVTLNDIAFNRVCLCYAVLQSFDEGLLTKCIFRYELRSRLIEDCYANIPNSPGHMRVYLNIYRVFVTHMNDS